MEQTENRSAFDLPPVWGAAAWALIYYWSGLDPMITAPAWLADIGSGLAAAGVLLAVWAVWQFAGLSTPVEANKTARTLITAGPYRYARHPIYLGMLVATFGFSLATGELTTLAIAAVFGWVLQKRFVEPEERMLEAEFGDRYRDWAATVKRAMVV